MVAHCSADAAEKTLAGQIEGAVEVSAITAEGLRSQLVELVLIDGRGVGFSGRISTTRLDQGLNEDRFFGKNCVEW